MSTILILGAGQIGRSVVAHWQQFCPGDRFVLHCFTCEEAEQARASLLARYQCDALISYGDILTSPGTLEDVVARFRPDYIIDTINTATVFSYHITSGDDSTEYICSFIYNLYKVLQRYPARYIKVSTTGLGGLGFNILFTHGDASRKEGLSDKLLHKMAAAGILNQLLWNLSHTPVMDIHLVIPATLVGWDTIELLPLENGLRQALVHSGENKGYTISEVLALTDRVQMGCVTKEEVAAAVFDCARPNGAGRNGKRVIEGCLISAMDQSIIGPSEQGAHATRKVVEELKQHLSDKCYSLISGNLGLCTAYDILHVYLLVEWIHSPGNLEQFRAHRLSISPACLMRFFDERQTLRQYVRCVMGPDFAPDEAQLESWIDLLEHSAFREQALALLEAEPCGEVIAGTLVAKGYDMMGFGRKRAAH